MRTIVYCLLLIGWCACQSTPSTKQPGEKFAFAFFTDVHLGDQNHVGYPGLRKALANAKCKQVDFILLGGDNVDIDGLVNQREVALERYGFYKSVLDSSGMAIYPAIGNHDRYFGDTTDVIYYDGLFKQFFAISKLTLVINVYCIPKFIATISKIKVTDIGSNICLLHVLIF